MASYLTVDELCKKLKLRKSRIYELTHLRKIPHMKVGRTLLFDEEEIDRWLKDKRVPVEEGSSIKL